MIASRQTPRRRSCDHPGMGLEARRHCAGRGRAVGAGDGAVQCMAGAVSDLSGDGLADRWRRRRTLARRAGGGDGGLVVRPRLFRAGPVLDRLRVPGRCAHFRLAVALRRAWPARLSRAVHRTWFRAGAADLDRECLAGDRARSEPDVERMAARSDAVGLSLECVRLCADRAAGAGADGVADRPVGPDVSERCDLRKPRGPDRWALAAGARPWIAPVMALALLVAMGIFGGVRSVAAADRMSSQRSSCASCSPTCSRTSNSTTPPRRR